MKSLSLIVVIKKKKEKKQSTVKNSEVLLFSNPTRAWAHNLMKIMIREDFTQRALFY